MSWVECEQSGVGMAGWVGGPAAGPALPCPAPACRAELVERGGPVAMACDRPTPPRPAQLQPNLAPIHGWPAAGQGRCS